MNKRIEKSRASIKDGQIDISQDELHTHSFIIPAEWKQKPNSSDGYGDMRYIDQQRPITTIVTKILCACGAVKRVKQFEVEE